MRAGWVPRVRAGRRVMGVFVWVAAFLALAVPAASQWRVAPELRVTGGDESDLVIDPGLTRTMVPGGPFVEITPTLSARRWAGRGALFDLGTFASLQRFLNDDGRVLYAQTVWGDLLQSFGREFRGRVSVSMDYFDDSERETVRRWSGGGEVGLGWGRSPANAEIWGGAYRRWYPELTTTDAGNRSTTYAEAAWSGGTTLRFSPMERVAVRGDGILQTTDARDSYFDSRSWTAQGTVDARLATPLFLTLSGTYQQRDFTDRTAADDRDTYWQLGAGLRYVIAGTWATSVRYGRAMYTWPDGSEEDSHRFAVAIHYVWGRRSAPPVPRVDVDALTRGSGGSIQRPDEGGNVRFRIQAPDAGSVAVAGDFNGWSPEVTRLRPAGDGWWEIDLRLDPGNYEYVYVVDGVWTTPPEAKITVEDGFGGRNGVLEVLPLDV